MVTKNDMGGKGASNSPSIWHCGDQVLFAIWTCRFSVNNIFPFPLATAFWIGIVSTNKQSGVKMVLSVITAPIVLALLINFLNRRCNVNQIVIMQIWSASPIQDMNTSAPKYGRCEGLVLLAKIPSASPNCRDNAYLQCCSNRKQKYWVLQRNGTFKLQKTFDRHNARQNLNYCVLPRPPNFSLPSTFKVKHARRNFI